MRRTFLIITHHVARRSVFYTIAAIVAVATVLFLLLLPPFHFPKGAVIVIEDDMSFDQVVDTLEAKSIIRSGLLFRIVARVGQADRTLQAGTYLFETPEGLTSVLYRLIKGISKLPLARVTIPEGYTVREMGNTLALAIPGFDVVAFNQLATPYEGYLFPDTYLFPYDSTPGEVVERMRLRFAEIQSELSVMIALSSRPFDSIVTMASILEKEAKTEDEMRMISGILWKRMELERPLQVDAVFGYIKGVDTYHPSGEDLEIDSRYNTYKYIGLPPGAIGNPGVVALRAALVPLPSDYLYYLTGRDGVMYYAKTFEEHKENRALYLD